MGDLETGSKRSYRPGFGLIYVLGATMIVAVVLGGIWTLSRLAQQELEAEVKVRGRSLTRQFASQLYEHPERHDSARLSSLSDEILREDGLRYVIIIDRQGKVLVSNSRLSWRPTSIPNELRTSACRTNDTIIRSRHIGNEALYDIAVRLAPSSASTAESLQDGNSETHCIGTLHLGISQQRLLDQQRSAQLLTWGISTFIMLSAIFGYFMLRSILVNPLLTLSETLQNMPEEACRKVLGDTTCYGELDTLNAAMRQILQKHSRKIARLQRSRRNMYAQSEALRIKNEQQAATLQQQSGSLCTLSEQARKNLESFSSLNEHAQSAIGFAATSLTNVKDMEHTVGTTMNSVDEIRRQVATNTERIVELGEEIAQISNVVKMIDTIAAQTKLIAFNAGIEAAGAGEAGGRFSIVAAEVRRLADTVVESVEEIKESVSSIQTATSELILSSETGIRKVNQGVLQISATRETLCGMSDLLEKNSVSLNELLESIRLHENQQRLIVNGVKDMSLQFGDVTESVRCSHEIAREIGAMVEELEEGELE